MLAAMRVAEEMALLKRVSRSFYLSVRVLPAPMRRGVCLGYLLARASDTLADEQDDPRLLDDFEKQLEGGAAGGRPVAPGGLSGNKPPAFRPRPPSDGRIHPDEVVTPLPGSPAEQELLSRLPELIASLAAMPPGESALIRDVLATIISGQRLDMARFARADAAHPVRLANAAELDDYTWRVAGCVGRFWTRFGFLALGERFSGTEPEALERLGIRFGQGLQLVNILRDEAGDIAQGRGYLPSPRAEWMAKARDSLAAGLAYAAAMRLRRLHIAVALPARIGLDTLDAMQTATGVGRVKIPRRRVWLHLAAAAKSSLSPGTG